MHDVIIIGGGPAGLTAGIYAARAGREAVIFERLSAGGQMMLTYDIDNYPGIPKIEGGELSARMREHAAGLGVGFRTGGINGIERRGNLWALKTRKGEELAKTVIVATGGTRRKLDAPGEDRFTGRGVSYCATCDGGFFKDKVAAVVGGGNTAFEDAAYLASLCSKVYLIHRRDGFRATERLVEQVKANSRIEFLTCRTVNDIVGEESVRSVTLASTAGEPDMALEVDAVFVAVGIVPESGLLVGLCEISESGHVVASEDCMTEQPGLFVAGDVRLKPLYQVATAVADGAVSATAAVRYINENEGTFEG